MRSRVPLHMMAPQYIMCVPVYRVPPKIPSPPLPAQLGFILQEGTFFWGRQNYWRKNLVEVHQGKVNGDFRREGVRHYITEEDLFWYRRRSEKVGEDGATDSIL